MATLFNLVSRDAQIALTEFSTQFDLALTGKDFVVWAEQFGQVNTSRAIQTKYPIPVSAAGYVERKGDDKMRDLFEKSCTVTPKEWADGVAALASVVEAPDFVGWGTEPVRMATEARRQPNRMIAQLLHDNGVLDFDGQALFSNAHPFNIYDASVGTFQNDYSSTNFDIALIQAARIRFRKRKGPNGMSLGARITDVLVPAALEETVRSLLESNLMYNAQLAGASNTNVVSENLYKGAINIVVADELLDDNYVYFFDRNIPAYIFQDGGAPEEILYTKADALYKDTGKIGLKYVLLMGYAGALAQGIERVHIG